MKEKIQQIKKLYQDAMTLLEGCNEILKDDEKLSTINSQISGAVKNLNDIVIRETTGVKIQNENEKP